MEDFCFFNVKYDCFLAHMAALHYRGEKSAATKRFITKTRKSGATRAALVIPKRTV